VNKRDVNVVRSTIIAELVADGVPHTPAVTSAMRAVPRHLFAPGASVEAAHSPFDLFVTKRDACSGPP